MRGLNVNIFENEFDLIKRDLSEIKIKETYDKSKCLIWDANDSQKGYNSFLLSKNSRSKTICELVFYKSSDTGKYLPRPIFKRVSHDGDIRTTRSKDKVTISFNTSEEAKVFWKLINFIKAYKDIVEVDELEDAYKVVSKNSYFLEFDNKSEKEKAEDILALVKKASLDSNSIRSITFEARKKDLETFYYLLKNPKLKNGMFSHDRYRDKYDLPPGEEAIWHHFLVDKNWILGLNIDIVFIKDFLTEQSIGNPTSKGRGNPKVDLLGLSEYTTLVELKTSTTEIFKKKISKGRANTWDFTSDFIEGVSQCYGQIDEINKHFEAKQYVDSDGVLIDKRFANNVDPKSIFICGCRNSEFPLYKGSAENKTKFQTFHRFRRGNRLVEIITFDELFERSYYIVYDKHLPKNWWELSFSEMF